MEKSVMIKVGFRAAATL